jgi:hypothetical protein
MAKREHASGQSQDTPKQAAGGGPSRSSNPQAVNQPANTNHRDYNYSSIIDFHYTDGKPPKQF